MLNLAARRQLQRIRREAAAQEQRLLLQGSADPSEAAGLDSFESGAESGGSDADSDDGSE